MFKIKKASLRFSQLLTAFIIVAAIPEYAFSCVSTETLCHRQREVANDITHHISNVFLKNNYWTGNPLGIMENIHPSDEWDEHLRSNGRAQKNTQSLLDSHLYDAGIERVPGGARDQIRNEFIIHSFMLRVSITEQLSRDGESIFHVTSELEVYEPVITLYSRPSRALSMTFLSTDSVWRKSEIESTIYNTAEDAIMKFIEMRETAKDYCHKENTCNSAMDLFR